MMSCYVGMEGWKTIEQYLRDRLYRNRHIRAMLIFSRRGIEQSGGVALIDVMRNFLDELPTATSVDICVVDDTSQRALFHPKAHGSQAGLRTRVVVGSANLTFAGMHGHYEMASVVENDPVAWIGFEAAMHALRAVACSLRDDQNLRLLRSPLTAGSPPAVRLSGAPPTPRDPLTTGSLDLPTSHATAALGEAMHAIAAFFSLGHKLSRSVQTLDFSTTIDLTSLRRAGILKQDGATVLTRNVSMDTGSGKLKVKLFSKQFETKLSRFKREIGKLYGATTVELAGISWSPQAWAHGLRATWARRIEALGVESLHHEVMAFCPTLIGDFDPGKPGFAALEKGLAIAHPNQWEASKACELLELAKLPIVADGVDLWLRRRIANIAAAELKEALQKSLKDAATEDRFSHLCSLPRPASVFTPSAGDAIEILADISLLAIAAHTESGEGAKNLLAERFACMLAPDPNPSAIIQEVHRWKQQVSCAPLPTLEQQAAMLSHAWERFCRWFRTDRFDPGHFHDLPDILKAPGAKQYLIFPDEPEET